MVSARLDGAWPASRVLNRIDRKRLAVEVFQAKVEDLVENGCACTRARKAVASGGETKHAAAKTNQTFEGKLQDLLEIAKAFEIVTL